MRYAVEQIRVKGAKARSVVLFCGRFGEEYWLVVEREGQAARRAPQAFVRGLVGETEGTLDGVLFSVLVCEAKRDRDGTWPFLWTFFEMASRRRTAGAHAALFLISK